jgi:hypothetical protein
VIAEEAASLMLKAHVAIRRSELTFWLFGKKKSPA